MQFSNSYTRMYRYCRKHNFGCIVARKKFGAAVFMHPNCDRKDYIDNVIRGAYYTFKALPNISF